MDILIRKSRSFSEMSLKKGLISVKLKKVRWGAGLRRALKKKCMMRSQAKTEIKKKNYFGEMKAVCVLLNS